MSYYIYICYSNEKELLYIGKTNNLKRRIKEHEKTSKWIDEVKNIFYSELNTNIEMGIYEIYYINKYNPKYNILDNYNDIIDLEIKPLTFKPYEEFINIKVIFDDIDYCNWFGFKKHNSEEIKELYTEISMCKTDFYRYVGYIGSLNNISKENSEHLIFFYKDYILKFFKQNNYFPDITVFMIL